MRSTDTFYVVICSGLTAKIRVSFIASNASFIECERKRIIHSHHKHNDTNNNLNNNYRTRHSLLSSLEINEPCTDPTWTNCIITIHNDLTNKNYTFSSCIFSNVYAGRSGGAIYASGGATNLIVKDCTFSDCSCSGSNADGGSIYATNIYSFFVTNSLFEWTSTDIKQVDDGGAMCLISVPSVTIHDVTFNMCYVINGGGAIYIHTSSSIDSTAKVIENCRVLNFKGASDCAGGIDVVVNNQYDNFITNSLFSQCSNNYGGALYINYGSTNYSSYSFGHYALKNCLFNKNSASGGVGNDVYFYGYTPNNETPIFQYCFSTSNSPRTNTLDVVWLPLALRIYVSGEASNTKWMNNTIL